MNFFKFKNLKIKHKIIIIFMFILCFYFLFLFLNFIQLKKVNKVVDEIIPFKNNSIILSSMIVDSGDLGLNVDKFLSTGYQEPFEKSNENISNLNKNINKLGGDLSINTILLEVKEDIYYLSKTSNNINNSDINIKKANIYKNLKILNININSLLVKNTKNIDLLVIDQKSSIDNIIKIILILGILILFFILINGYILIISISKPLFVLNESVLEIIKGNFDIKIKTDSSDEIGQLSNSFNKMVSNLKESYFVLEQKVKERTLDLDKKVVDLSDSKKAIINLLQDIQDEKIKVEEVVVERTKELISEKARLLASINSLSFGFIISDMDHRVLLKNDAMIKLFGIKETDEISINNISELLGNNIDIKAQVELCIKDKKLCEIKEIAFDSKFFRGIIAPILTPEDNQTIGYVFLLEDITEEHAISKAKTEFVSLASHQLRTPLSAINWYTEMLLSGDAGKLNPEQSEFLEDIITSSKRMSSLVGTLLNVSRIELGTFAITPESKDLWEIIKDEVEDLKVQFDDKKIELKLLSDLKQVFVFVDPKLMSIVIQNLLTNSIKYNSSGGKVSISVDKKEETGEVILSVIDTGYGIPKENQEKIFTKMYRADNAVAIDAEGSGIGLYMIKSILETSGCSISFESPVKGQEKGTAFYVHIPKGGMKQIKANKRLGDIIS
jgi:signal transduction histidine kinase